MGITQPHDIFTTKTDIVCKGPNLGLTMLIRSSIVLFSLAKYSWKVLICTSKTPLSVYLFSNSWNPTFFSLHNGLSFWDIYIYRERKSTYPVKTILTYFYTFNIFLCYGGFIGRIFCVLFCGEKSKLFLMFYSNMRFTDKKEDSEDKLTWY